MIDDDAVICEVCNGSGEGQYDGTRCHACKGRGTRPLSEEERAEEEERADLERRAGKDDDGPWKKGGGRWRP